MKISDEVMAIFATRSGDAYFGERVTLREHALQAAYFAQSEAAPAALVVAALLHDVGHLLTDIPGDIADWRDDSRHEESGAAWLAGRFPAAISEPVRLHVPAKRFLCATDVNYAATLSPASVVTLTLQGGPMSTAEAAGFQALRYSTDALRIRQWDDRAKIAGLVTPDLHEYRDVIERAAAARP